MIKSQLLYQLSYAPTTRILLYPKSLQNANSFFKNKSRRVYRLFSLSVIRTRISNSHRPCIRQRRLPAQQGCLAG